MYYYKQVKDGEITSVEAKSVDIPSPDFVQATSEEYDEFIASLPPVEPETVIDPFAKMSELEKRVKDLEDK